jgi:hypothetical protein
MIKKVLRFFRIAALVLIITIFSLFAIILALPYILPTPFKGVGAMERDFDKNKETIIFVKNYLIELDFESIHINSSNGTMFTGLEYGNIIIESDSAKEAIQLLFRNGYKAIGKKENSIRFLRWSNLDSGTGAVYSIDGNIPDESSLQHLTKIEPMHEDGWYYYEGDFNEWRIRNRGN